MEIDCIEFEVEVDFGSEDFVCLVDSGTAGNDVIFCKSQDGVVSWGKVLSEVAFEKFGFGRDFSSLRLGDWEERWFCLGFDVHLCI